jgi:hypothetical protein
MLDITDRDIADLNDTDLRSLVALLAEASLRRRHLSTAAVMWGGDQNASDGGLDVRVELDPGTVVGDFIPRSSTGFQVKKPKMGPAAIRSEMRQGNLLRESISQLVDRGGAYIIVSSGSNLSDAALTRRLEAMRSAVACHPNAPNLIVDFFDRQRLATWVRDFPGLCPWVRARIGRPVQGWRSFGDWTFAGDGSAGEFIADETARLYTGITRTGPSEGALSTLVGLQRMRATLARPGSSLRLVGLSGVGKTRLVQALFQECIGTEALDPSLAIYADLAHHPEPTPVAVATYLVQSQARSIIIVDNCPADLHRQLTQLCQVPGGTVSVVTVEYDIRDDMPEGTDVFRLEAASGDVVAKLVTARCPWLSQVDAQSIGTFSGGNARVGLALAQTVRVGESLSGLSDEALFSRLFRQRHADDAGLLAAAEACALVYSFDGETLLGEESEIPRLAALAECTPTVLHRHIAELIRRGLLQERSRWRAVLPHAIANRLAEHALENIPLPRLQEELVEQAPERLLQSYSRRLSYLHDSRVAVRIADDWLSASGLLGAHIGDLSPLGMALLANIAPVAPEAALTAIERVRDRSSGPAFFSIQNQNRDEFVRLLRKIAYDAPLFERCADLLVRFAAMSLDAEKTQDGQVLGIWTSLFSPFLSGTHASASQRMHVLDLLLRSDCCKKHQLAVRALTASLETFHFSSAYDFDFGARSRDYGYHPSTVAEQTAWFSAGIRLAMDVGASTAPSAPEVREALARQLPGLWVHTATQDLIMEAVQTLSRGGFWEDGWVAVKEAIWRTRDHPLEARHRLLALEETLTPKTLLDKIHLQVLRDNEWILDTEDTPDAIKAAMARADASAEELGRCAATDPEIVDLVLPELASSGKGRRWQFARGLARGATDLPALWSKLVEAVVSASPEAYPTVLMGYLSVWQEMDSTAVRAVVDRSINDARLTQWLPQLEIAVGLDGSSVGRFHRALAAGAPPWAFRVLSFGRLTDAISPVDLSGLLSSLAAAPDGWAVAVDILAMRLRSDLGDHADVGSLLSLGRTLLLSVEPHSSAHRRLDHDLATVASACLKGPEGGQAAIAVCKLLAEAFGRRVLSFHELHAFVKAVFRVQPIAALDAFLQPPPDHGPRYPTILSMFEDVSYSHRNPIGEVTDGTVLEWCARDPSRNFPAAATSVPYSQKGSEGTGLAWTDLAKAMLERAPEPRDVLMSFIARFEPHSWSGSRAAIIEANTGLLVSAECSIRDGIALLARQERQRLLEECRKERRWEVERSRHNDERFE